MLMQLFRAHNKALEELVGEAAATGTLTNFKTSYNHTLSFLKAEYGAEDINILSLDLEFIKRLYH
jgi:integrase